MKVPTPDVTVAEANELTYKDYLAIQTLKLRRWSFVGAFVMYSLFVAMDFVRFPAAVWTTTVPFRLVFAVAPILLLTVLFNRKAANNTNSHTSLLVGSYLSIGLTHTFVNYMAMTHGILFPSNGLVLIVLFGCLLTAIPIRPAIVSTLIIIIATEITSYSAGKPVGRCVSDGLFFTLYGFLCVGMNRVCAVILHENYNLLKKWKGSAITDELTGLYNRRHFNEQSDRLRLQAQRDGKYCGLLVIDLDHFKQLNDSLGHAVGDKALSELGVLLASMSRRPSDFAARFGGDEFVIFFYDINSKQLEQLAQELIERAHSITMSAPGKSDWDVTLSVGGACTEEHAEDLFDAADSALYKAKSWGRDQFCLADMPGLC